MRTILSLSALVLSVGASAAPPQPAPAPPPPGTAPGVFTTAPQKDDQAEANCHGRVVTARAERGLPKLPDNSAKAGDPLLIAAVDKTIGGCEVLVMRDNLSDIRPLPQFQDGPGKVLPLDRQ